MLSRWVATARAWRTRIGDEDGSTLVLYPFAVLIVLGLGGLALDSALYFQAHRETVDVAAALAGDVAGVIDEGAFATEGGVVRIDAERAAQIVNLTNQDLQSHPYDLRCEASLNGGDSVDVVCEGEAQAVLLPIVGLLNDMRLRGTSTARAQAG